MMSPVIRGVKAPSAIFLIVFAPSVLSSRVAVHIFATSACTFKTIPLVYAKTVDDVILYASFPTVEAPNISDHALMALTSVWFAFAVSSRATSS
jgi:hypothetical protein